MNLSPSAISVRWRDLMGEGGGLVSTDRYRARSRRLGLLMVALVLMGVADLLCTLTYMRMSGMLEANPIARLMIDIGGERQLVLFKLFTMALCCGALYLARRHAVAERCAWFCAAIMLALTFHWVTFNRSVPEYTNEMVTLALNDGMGEPMWVKLD